MNQAIPIPLSWGSLLLAAILACVLWFLFRRFTAAVNVCGPKALAVRWVVLGLFASCFVWMALRPRASHLNEGQGIGDAAVKVEMFPAEDRFWADAAAIWPIADLHPSAEAAARDLAVRLGRSLEVDGRTLPSELAVQGGDVPVAIREVFESNLSSDRHDGNATVRLSMQSPPGSPQTLIAELIDTGEDAAANPAVVQRARFVHKPWVDPPPDVLIGSEAAATAFHNPQPAVSAKEAREAALSHAVSRLLGRIERGSLDPGRASSILEAELRSGRIVVDRFEQRFFRAEGDVYHAAILVDPALLRADLETLAGRHAIDAEAPRMNLFGLSFGLFVLLGGIYFLLDTLTRGYHRP